MGQIVSNILNSNDENVQEVAISNSNAYKWPPKAGLFSLMLQFTRSRTVDSVE